MIMLRKLYRLWLVWFVSNSVECDYILHKRKNKDLFILEVGVINDKA